MKREARAPIFSFFVIFRSFPFFNFLEKLQISRKSIFHFFIFFDFLKFDHLFLFFYEMALALEDGHLNLELFFLRDVSKVYKKIKAAPPRFGQGGRPPPDHQRRLPLADGLEWPACADSSAGHAGPGAGSGTPVGRSTILAGFIGDVRAGFTLKVE